LLDFVTLLEGFPEGWLSSYSHNPKMVPWFFSSLGVTRYGSTGKPLCFESVEGFDGDGSAIDGFEMLEPVGPGVAGTRLSVGGEDVALAFVFT